MSSDVTVRLRDGAELWTTVTGTGPPVVCLHGGPGLWDYLAPLAELLDDTFTVIRFDQRGCGRSTGDGPYTIAQAVDDLEQIRAAFGFGQWAVAGHSWGAELAIRYTAQHQAHTTAVAYISGVGAGDGYREPFHAELDRRLGPERERLAELSAIPAAEWTPELEQEMCLLQWRTDFSSGPAAAEHARALWETRPPGAAINRHRRLAHRTAGRLAGKYQPPGHEVLMSADSYARRPRHNRAISDRRETTGRWQPRFRRSFSLQTRSPACSPIATR
jgi:proline iminopeptidase